MIAIQPLGQAPTTTPERATIIEDAVRATLQSFRMTVHPTGYWNITQEMFQRLSEAAYRRACEVGNRLGYTISYEEVSQAVRERNGGYKVSDLNPLTRQPLAISPAPVVELPAMLAPSVQIPAPPPAPVMYLPPPPPVEPAPIRYQTVRVPGAPAVSPLPVIIEQIPSPLLPGATIGVPAVSPPAEVRPASGTKWLLVAGLAAVLLSRAA